MIKYKLLFALSISLLSAAPAHAWPWDHILDWAIRCCTTPRLAESEFETFLPDPRNQELSQQVIIDENRESPRQVILTPRSRFQDFLRREAEDCESYSLHLSYRQKENMKRSLFRGQTGQEISGMPPLSFRQGGGQRGYNQGELSSRLERLEELNEF